MQNNINLFCVPDIYKQCKHYCIDLMGPISFLAMSFYYLLLFNVIADEFPEYMRDCIVCDYKGRYYQDFYR